MIRSPSKKHLMEANLPLGVHAASSSDNDDEDFKDFEEAEQFPIEDEATQVSTVASTHK